MMKKILISSLLLLGTSAWAQGFDARSLGSNVSVLQSSYVNQYSLHFSWNDLGLADAEEGTASENLAKCKIAMKKGAKLLIKANRVIVAEKKCRILQSPSSNYETVNGSIRFI